MTNLPINISNAPAKIASSKQPSNNGDVAQQDGQGFGNVLTRQVADSAKPAEPVQSASGDAGKEPAKQLSEKDEVEATPIADTSGTVPADLLAALLAQQNMIAAAQPVNPQPVANALIDASTAATSGMEVIEPGLADMKAIESAVSDIQMIGPATADMKAIGPATAAIESATAAIESATVAFGSATVDMKEVLSRKLGIKSDAVAPAAVGMKAAASTEQDGGNSKVADALPALGATRPKAESAVPDSKEFAKTLKTSFDAKESASAAASQVLRGLEISELASTAQQTPVSAPALTAVAPASPTSINTPVTQAGWGDEFGQKITWMATQRNQSAELHLNPPQLGPLDVVLKVNGDQATAMFTSPHAAVREAIEQALPKLREMLADNGIMLGNAMVSDQPARNDQDDSSRKSQGKTPISDNAPVAVSMQGTRISTTSRHHGMVDTFA